MTTHRLKIAFLLGACTWACAITWLTTHRCFVAGGSDILVEVHSVHWLSRAVTLALVICVWTGSVLLPIAVRWKRWALRGIGLIALALSTHLVVFDGLDGVLEERWFLLRFERARFDRAEGLVKDWVTEKSSLGVVLAPKQGGRRQLVFTGFYPWHIDIESSLQLHGL